MPHTEINLQVPVPKPPKFIDFDPSTSQLYFHHRSLHRKESVTHERERVPDVSCPCCGSLGGLRNPLTKPMYCTECGCVFPEGVRLSQLQRGVETARSDHRESGCNGELLFTTKDPLGTEELLWVRCEVCDLVRLAPLW